MYECMNMVDLVSNTIVWLPCCFRVYSNKISSDPIFALVFK